MNVFVHTFARLSKCHKSPDIASFFALLWAAQPLHIIGELHVLCRSYVPSALFAQANQVVRSLSALLDPRGETLNRSYGIRVGL